MLVMKRESWLPAVPESAPLARAIVRDAAAEYGLGGEATWDIMLATSEAVANAVLHGSGCETDLDDGVLLIVEIDEHSISIEVCDCGSFNAELRPAAQDDIGGRGIPIIAALADHFELVPEPSRTRVRFGKRLPVTV
jgi:anti-sigma regulatory factor (Ser/Thr protein kinase)